MLKIIPMIMAFISLLNSTLSFFGIDLVVLSYIGCTSLLSISFIYLASYCFGFCAYHRMFLHYVVINDLLSLYDYHIGIPVSDVWMFLLHMIVTGISLYLILFLYLKHRNTKNTKGLTTKDN